MAGSGFSATAERAMKPVPEQVWAQAPRQVLSPPLVQALR
jgi:hypothetical protein